MEVSMYNTLKLPVGIDNFEKIRNSGFYYVDKTKLIEQLLLNWGEVNLFTRPRRFGKTLNMSMLEHFFSNRYEGDGALFEGLSIWTEKKYRRLQGTYPVISLSFASVKEKNYKQTKERICQIHTDLYNKHIFLVNSGLLTEEEQRYFLNVNSDMNEITAAVAIHKMSDFLYRYYKKKVIILLDEYDTPMQEAYVNGFWEELVSFTRSLFNSTFKTNPYLERGIMTGITRVSKESVFSDLNNLKVVTTTSNEYATAFGFTEKEVFAAMDEFGMTEKEKVNKWYDGFNFGEIHDVYNPWSILNLLDTGKFTTYWANTSANSLVGKLLREGSGKMKEQFEVLIQGGSIESEIDEQIVYDQLDDNEEAIWSLLLASGYLKVQKVDFEEEIYQLRLTNYEVQRMFRNMIKGWFKKDSANYNDFVKALLLDDLDAMNEYMNRITGSIFSYFDTGKRESQSEPERFYHGFVLGLIVELQGRYVITSNRESGFGRYDVILEPCGEENAIIMEFKVFNTRKENNLSDTLQAARAQIEEKQYEKVLIDHGVAPERIRKYGFAFEGKRVLIG